MPDCGLVVEYEMIVVCIVVRTMGIDFYLYQPGIQISINCQMRHLHTASSKTKCLNFELGLEAIRNSSVYIKIRSGGVSRMMQRINNCREH